MKKIYVSPSVEDVNIGAAQMLASSIIVDGDKTTDTSKPGGQLGDDRRGDWGDLWK